MRPLTVLMGVAALLLVAGSVAWVVSGSRSLPGLTVWLWLAAFAVLCLPLVVLAVVRLLERLRNR